MAGEILEQLSDDLKTNEALAGMNTANDIAMAFLDSKGKASEFEGKIASYEGEITNLKQNTIPKLSQDASQEQKEAYFSAVGRPQTKDDYKFEPAEGVEHSEQMVAFARDLFHKAYLNQEQASIITGGWDAFVAEVEKVQEQERVTAIKNAEEAVKKEFGDKYAEAVSLADRVCKKHMGEDFDALYELKLEDGTKLGNSPMFVKYGFKFAQLTGEDTTPPASRTGLDDSTKGEVKIIYDKSPAPPTQS